MLQVMRDGTTPEGHPVHLSEILLPLEKTAPLNTWGMRMCSHDWVASALQKNTDVCLLTITLTI